MKVARKWWVLGAVVLGAAGLLAAGVPLGTLVLALALLACPLFMMLGMRTACQMGPQQHQGPASREVAKASPEREPVAAGKGQSHA
ncbi:MAG: hypothetical protein HY660_18635 [Armatimonadetes bacterium]|nr:hypothetical protein [Armatimonadota bacterium]